jgi:ATP/maltotriose-dependent transcriptional regulator MalT
LTTAHLASLRVEQGRIDEAAALIEPFEEWVSSCAPLAEIHLARGDAALAVAVLERGLRELVDDSLRIAPLLALLVCAHVRLGDLDGAAAAEQRLAELADRVDVPLLRGEAWLAAARVAVARGDDINAIDLFQRALSAVGTDARPALAATVRLELAEALARAGRETAAITEARAALSCFERLGAAPRRDRTAALLRKLGDTSRARSSDDSAVELTPREREVLELLRNGLSNAQIGARLFISAKTAEHHVGRVLTKLGVRTRGEAAALAVRMSAGTPMQK